MDRMPCGCKGEEDGVDDMSEPTGNFLMRFICDKNGRLLKGAPGNYECGEVYSIPYRHSKFDFWELVEDVPEVDAHDLEDETVWDDFPKLVPEENYVPEENVAGQGFNADPDEEAAIEPYVKYNVGTGEVKEWTPSYDESEETTIAVSDDETEPEVDDEAGVDVDREELFRKLDEAGVEYSKHTRTEFLLEKIEALDDEVNETKETEGDEGETPSQE